MNDDEFDPQPLTAGRSPAELMAIAEAVEEELAAAALSRESEDALLDLLEIRERAHRKAVLTDAALYVEISDRSAYRRAGYATLHQLFTHGLRVSEGQSRHRRSVAAAVGRFTAMTGERLEPELPETAAAVADGAIGGAHVTAIDEVMDKIPSGVSPAERVRAEAMLADAARTLNPAGVSLVGNRILAHLDPDGSLVDEKDRARRRKLVLSPQDRQLMSVLRGQLDPELRAELEVMLGLWAAPGMNNPGDPDSPFGEVDQPGLAKAVLAAAAERDDRQLGQRQHDALKAMLKWVNGQAAVARPDSLRNQIVVTVSDADLARGAGIAWTATGTRMPIADLVKLAAEAVPHLAVFAEATAQALYLGHGPRSASRAQRLALFARDRGCTAPGCSRPFAATEAHHMPDYADGAPTDVDHLGAACGNHNRWNGKKPGQWESTVLGPDAGSDAGRVAWRPVGRGGDWIVNPLFHPEKLGKNVSPPRVNHRLGSVEDPPPPTATTPRRPDDDVPPPATPRPVELRRTAGVVFTDSGPPDADTGSGAEGLLAAILAA